ncbi:hypothetical protein CWN85_08675 [Vibrio splendidus]|uniref:hypothetical protein n=1 Tax=Vibrio splendidus TaxID=29497 RepID=UPI000D3AA437|nr:hypothetical protein [Vibrio splendidus]PTP02656.1 hypothetical protein CWN86_19915 [Vibrio splendidus]PTP24147.1 hypothetical protein CWN85_08675 [Vibrio splendidus]
MQANQSISIQVNTLDEALNIENVAALNIAKYKQNSVEGQENLQSSFVRMWRDIHKQAGEVLDTFKVSEEQSL